MTINRRDGRESGFNAWIREQRELDSEEYQISVSDSDLWVHRYSSRNEHIRQNAPDIRQMIDHIMLVEVKCFNAIVPYAQRDTLQLIDRMLRSVTVKNGKRRPIKVDDSRRPGSSRIVRWLGVHCLELSADRPDNSDRIIWDNKHEISEARLIDILRFDYDPDSPGRLLDTRRHHHLKPIDRLLPLMDRIAIRSN